MVRGLHACAGLRHGRELGQSSTLPHAGTWVHLGLPDGRQGVPEVQWAQPAQYQHPAPDPSDLTREGLKGQNLELGSRSCSRRPS